MKLLRETIRRLIQEGLRFEEDLMILWHPKTPGLYLLCDAEYDTRYDLDKEKFHRRNVKAMILTRDPKDPCNGAREVAKAAAIEGYGPTLYDAVMELTDGIINDRKSVSGAAKRVMRRYKDGRPDVEKSLLDNVDDRETYPRTLDPEDDCASGDFAHYKGGAIFNDRTARWENDPLSYSYNKSLSPTVSAWLQTGNQFIKRYESSGDLFYTDMRKWGSQLFEDAHL